MTRSTSNPQLRSRPGDIHRSTVGASLLAKNAKTPRYTRQHALSLTFFASKPAPTRGYPSGRGLHPAQQQ
ncbi:hypothetical protein C1Y22_07440 [Pseudomonas sp. MPR-R2A5]|nr:hypothetical protein C1Y22_07440 [Pseudomonas sp. MPR-R2A5]